LSVLTGASQHDGWDDMRSTLNVRLDGKLWYVAIAMDMAIVEKAEVFLCYGVSFGFLFRHREKLTCTNRSKVSSNVVMLRKELDPSTNRNQFLWTHSRPMDFRCRSSYYLSTFSHCAVIYPWAHRRPRKRSPSGDRMAGYNTWLASMRGLVERRR
jgi:hypothetical protein